MPADNPKELIRVLYSAFAAEDVATVMGALHHEIVWDYPGKPPYAMDAPFIGHESVVNNVFVRLATEWSDFKVEPQEMIAEGNKVVVLVRETGTAKESGRTVDIRGVHVWTVSDGKATSVEIYADTLQFAKAVGQC